ncbi:MAG TPA: CRTAC1 family protein [Verrucomicrobiae bacterium]
MKSFRFASRFVLAAALAAAGHPVSAAEKPAYLAPGTQRMAQLLESIIRQANPMKNTYRSAERVERVRAFLATADDPQRKVPAQSQLAIELLQAGQSLEAIEEFKKFERLAKENGVAWDAENRTTFRSFVALAHLRLGEQENCLFNHTIDSCLLPIRAAGVHQAQRGSRGAIEVVTEQLTEFPDDLRARWMLNLCYMTLGEYPAKVPARWLIPPKVFESDYDIKRFYDAAGRLSLDINGLSGGCITEDFDGDGYLDLMLSSFGLRDPLRLFHNNGDGTFTERTREAGLLGEVGGLNILQADYNNDGHPDVLVLRGAWLGPEGKYPNSLLRNNGDGTFADVTEEAGLLSFHPTQTATWLDFDGDGWLDLFIGNETMMTGEKHPCELYRNNRNGTFTECAAASGVAAIGMVKGVAAGDFNNDGRPDLYVSRRGQPNILFRNDGPAGADKSGAWKFSDVSVAARVTEPTNSFPCWFFDYDNDGWPDIFVADNMIQNVGDVAADYLGLPTNAERARLYRNNHDGTFTDVTKAAKLDKVLVAMGANFGDLDNDGWLDFYIGTGQPSLGTLMPNRMFRNAEGRFFQDVTTSGGFGHLQKGHAIAFADLDNDGDQDVFAEMGGAYSGDIARSALYENPGHGNHWITLKLEGVQSNRAAIGARIKVTVLTGTGPRAIYKTVGTGGSFGASPLRQEIGLGQAKAIKAVDIFWPVTGRTQTLNGLAMDHFYKVREGATNAMAWTLKSFKFASGAAAHDHSQHQHE